MPWNLSHLDMCMHRCSLSSSSLLFSFDGARTPPRAFLFPHDLFWSTGKHLRQLRGDGPPPGPRLLVRGRCSPCRGSPSPANYACLFLPLPLSFHFSSSPPPSRCLFRSFSLAFSRYHPFLPLHIAVFIPFLPRPVPPPSISEFWFPSSCCPRANFLHSFACFNTLHLSSSIIEQVKFYRTNCSFYMFGKKVLWHFSSSYSLIGQHL